MSIGAISASISVRGGATSPVTDKTKTPASTSATPSTSSVVSVAAAALKEATETSAETAKEAGHGDRVAQRLIAKQHEASVSNSPAQTPAKGTVNGSGQITGETINTKA
ncbi:MULTISPECIES: hypothetical protein [unclassified Pseudomonas]|uniref:hypothetical protein n=1 Tax=unclassified Pseudomonas TaxID=196821 RepID=UPI002AC9BC88|nr:MULTISPECIES: hypothetical protein [unclassified Pseudomonas]MEB0042071.1 hypothetical protein [Pseudomonas sp. MH10]MEB0076544.1 hypothetical protein [Pseudomonas sp. MH10out]MEB0091292.1 hypothetical protein [Pseudomonas sp. CCI4.2]MEB0101500.1 hypothetical protein [Pseudomonas sp. CCI3.2]MEB0119783.1 hypothetical protein [Pseudomonas sp. CCI1.2]